MRATTAYFLARRDRGDRGATSTEYALLVGFMVFAMVSGATLFGIGLSESFSNLANAFSVLDDHI